MYKFIFSILSCLLIINCNNPHYKNPHIIISTDMGDIEVELFADKAPLTVKAFLSYVDSGFYTNSSFYRVVLLEGLSSSLNVGLIQGGSWQTNDKLHPGVAGIAHESTKQTGLSHTSGTISLARTKPGTANTEFFICIGDQSQFDHGNQGAEDMEGYAAFGRVFAGMTVVRKIHVQKKQDERFTEKIVIKKIKRL